MWKIGHGGGGREWGPLKSSYRNAGRGDIGVGDLDSVAAVKMTRIWPTLDAFGKKH